MIIKPRPRFQHAGSLHHSLDSKDPREARFAETEVEVDLRECEFVRSPAVLWCVTYLLLAKSQGCACRLLVPMFNTGVCAYLKSTGLFTLLKSHGIEVDDQGVGERGASHLVIPLTRFDHESQVEEITNNAYEALRELGLGAANLHPVVSETFAELAMNAVQHARSTIGAYGLIQFDDTERGRRFVCGVADGGIGIRRALEENPVHQDRAVHDWSAIELAVRERVSGTSDATRGIGLYGVAEDMRKAGRSLTIHSGIGSLQIDEDMQTGARRTRLFPGTLAYASIPA